MHHEKKGTFHPVDERGSCGLGYCSAVIRGDVPPPSECLSQVFTKPRLQTVTKHVEQPCQAGPAHLLIPVLRVETQAESPSSPSPIIRGLLAGHARCLSSGVPCRQAGLIRPAVDAECTCQAPMGPRWIAAYPPAPQTLAHASSRLALSPSQRLSYVSNWLPLVYEALEQAPWQRISTSSTPLSRSS